ncbi:MAG: hypothetical protein KGD63_05975 [Candidatus Lokiarchaeota archaeon]|nr:hypothetical protein [Candidatus Lokiarchaeota archaeon]
MENKKIKKLIKKFSKISKKKKILLVSYLVIFMFICSSFHSLNVRADDYSTYLYQNDITVDVDNANLMEESASYENDYRNYFFSGTEFVYDTGLSEWIGLTSANRYNYLVSQTYLDNLDDERAFKQQETLIDDYSYSISDYNISEGTYNEFETNHSMGLLPNQDIYKEWTGMNGDDDNDVNLHYTLIDEYITDTSDSWIQADQYQDGVIDILEFENKNLTHSPYMIRIYLYAGDLSGYASDDFKIALNYSGSWNEKTQAFAGSNLNWYEIDFNADSLTQLQLDNIAVRVIAPTVIGGAVVAISSLYLKIYCNGSDFIENIENDDTEYSNVNSYERPTNATFNFDSLSELDDFNLGGLNGNDCNITEISDSGHNTILYINHTIYETYPYLWTQFDNKQYGKIFTYVKVNSTSSNFQIQVRQESNIACRIIFQTNNLLHIIHNGGSTIIGNYESERWYLFALNFNVPLQTFDLYMDNELIYDDLELLPCEYINRVLYQSYPSKTYASVDNLDYNWSYGYYEGRSIDNNTIDLILETNVIDLIDCYQLDYKLIYNLNITSNIEVYIYDFLLDLWILINNDTISSEKTLNYYNTTLINLLSSTNTSLFRFRLSKMYNNNTHFKLSLDYLEVKLYYSIQLYNAVHYIYISYYCYTSGGTLRGRIDLIMEVHKTYIKYDTSTRTWTGSGWLGIANQQDYELNDTTIDIETMELQYHIRYGNGLDGITKINVLFNAILNYNLSVVSNEIREFELGGIWSDITTFRFMDFSYHKKDFQLANEGFFNDSNNNKRAFSCLRGVRVLRSETVQEYNRFFEIPYFSDDIDVSESIEGLTGFGSGSEPKLPSGTYWTYETFRLSTSGSVGITVENWTVDYNMVYAEKYDAKYPYKEESLRRKDLGDWKFKIGDWKISFNFLRNAVCTILNLIFFFFQYLGYYITAGLSYIFMYLGVNILVIIWNYLIFYIFIALIWVLWYLYLGLYTILTAIWEGLVWVYETLLLPFLEWLMYEFLPLAIEVFIIVWAFLITLLIYCMTLGQIDFDETYATVYDMLRTAADFLLENAIIILNNLPALFIAIGLYLVLIGLTYIKYIYAKARGYKDRAEALYGSLMTYLLPITLTYQIIRKIYDALPDSVA